MRPGRLCGRGSKLSTIRNGHPAAPGGLQRSRLSVQHGRSASSHRPALTLARCSVAAHCALLRVLATPALRASDVRKLTRGAPCFTGLIGGYCTLNSQWSSCCALRLAVLPCSLGLLRPVSRTARGEAPSPLGLLRAAPPTGRALRAPPPLPPSPVSAKILRIFGRGNCKETIFALENGIFRRKNRPVPAVHAAGND